jgi:HlyD family secretion protein
MQDHPADKDRSASKSRISSDSPVLEGMDRKIEKKRFTPRRIAGYTTIAVFFFVIVYSLIFGDRSSKLNVETEKLTITIVEEGAFQEYIPVTGNVLPIKTIYLDAIEGGRVEKRFVEAGTMVNEGDEILKLVNTNLLLDIMYREAQFFEQRNNLRNTRLSMEQNRLTLRRSLVDLDYDIQQNKRTLERNTQLMEPGLISQEEFDQSKDEYEYLIKKKDILLETQRQDSLFRQTQIEQLEESLKRMESNLEFVKQKQENLIIKAPITGYLTSLNAEIGESKREGERLGQIDVLDGFKVRANIDEHYITRVEINRSGSFELAGEVYRLIVKKIYPEVRDGRFEVDLEFEDEDPPGIRRGQTLHIRLELGDLAEATLLARGGFYQTTGGQWVYILDESGEFATKRAIKLGRQNPRTFEVLEGLKRGDRVITSSYDSYGEIDKLILKGASK